MTFNFAKYQEIRGFVEKLSKKSQIIAISKFHPAESVKEAILCGIRHFGENRVQEADIKFRDLRKIYTDLELHLTGPLQTNKVKKAIDIFDVFQTLDRKKLADEFSKHIIKLKNKKFFIQINTGKEKNKSGILPQEADDFIIYCKDKLGLNIVGLMCIPPINEKPEDHFQMLRETAQKNNLFCLSMGMSDDYKIAIKEDATHLRIGTLLFGKRALK